MSTILDIENTPMAADKRNVPNRLRTDIVKDIIIYVCDQSCLFSVKEELPGM